MPAQIRHLLLVILAVAVTGLIEILPTVSIPTQLLPFVTAGLTYLLAWVTPLVQSYGVGSDIGDH